MGGVVISEANDGSCFQNAAGKMIVSAMAILAFLRYQWGKGETNRSQSSRLKYRDMNASFLD